MSGIALRGMGITKRFGRVAALRGIDFEIAAGEAVAILGANGAGKSTLLRILAGLSRINAGRFEALRSDEKSVALSRESLRGEIGYVGHATLVYGELSAHENLRFAARLAGVASNTAELDAILDSVGLADVATRRAGTFSRGMSQRLAIARAVVHDPSVLLLDEPFTGLDELSAERLSMQLMRLRANGRSLILVTHDPRRAVELADRALVLHHGRILGRPTRSTSDGFDTESLRAQLSEIARIGEGTP